MDFKKSSKPKLVLDCRHINPHLFRYKFKYEDGNGARELLQKGDFIFSYDLKSAYHHLTFIREHQKYLGFSWRFDGVEKCFVFTVLPFGISNAGYIFTKVLREVTKHLSSQGKTVIMFLDDGLGGERDFDNAQRSSVAIKSQLQDLGF